MIQNGFIPICVYFLKNMLLNQTSVSLLNKDTVAQFMMVMKQGAT